MNCNRVQFQKGLWRGMLLQCFGREHKCTQAFERACWPRDRDDFANPVPSPRVEVSLAGDRAQC